MTSTLLTLDETASRLRTPPATLRFWRVRGTGPVSIKVGRRVMYRENDVENWLEAQALAAIEHHAQGAAPEAT